MKRRCEARLRDLVRANEETIAVGTTEQLRTLGSDIGSGGGWTFLVVTKDRLLFARWSSAESPHEEIRMDEVTAWADGLQYHNYVVVLTHRPLARREETSPRRLLWFRWRRGERDSARTQTIFRFSRRDTAAARAIRAELERRQAPHERLRFDERPRADRIRGSHVPLTRSRD